MQHSLIPINAPLNTNANDLNNFSIQQKQESIMKIQKFHKFTGFIKKQTNNQSKQIILFK